MMIPRTARFAGLIWMLWAIPAHAACSGSGLAFTCLSGSTSADVNSAISAAADGAVITFATGSYTLTSWSKFSNAKGATLICAAVGGCTINYTNNQVFGGDVFCGVNTHFYRVSGFVFDGGGQGASYGAIWIDDANGCTPTLLSQVRIDHNIFQNMNGGAVGVFIGDGGSQGRWYGVMDHNTFTNAVQMTPILAMGNSPSSALANALGTANNWFMEDNTLNFTSLPNASSGGCTDGWGGIGFVVRHNTSLNCLWAAHGATHAGGPVNYEFYNNNIQMNAAAVGAGVGDCYRCYHHQGSGTSIFFNNTFTPASGQGHNGYAISMSNYRAYAVGPSIDGGKPACDGTVTTIFSDGKTDGNRSPTSSNYGYPCWHQPGRDFNGILRPMYAWGNAWGDGFGQINLVVENFGGNPPPPGPVVTRARRVTVTMKRSKR